MSDHRHSTVCLVTGIPPSVWSQAFHRLSDHTHSTVCLITGIPPSVWSHTFHRLSDHRHSTVCLITHILLSVWSQKIYNQISVEFRIFFITTTFQSASQLLKKCYPWSCCIWRGLKKYHKSIHLHLDWNIRCDVIKKILMTDVSK